MCFSIYLRFFCLLLFIRNRGKMMQNLIDAEEYDDLYFNSMVSPTKFPEKFDLINILTNFDSDFKKLLHQLLLHYISILQVVYTT